MLKDYWHLKAQEDEILTRQMLVPNDRKGRSNGRWLNVDMTSLTLIDYKSWDAEEESYETYQ